MHAQLGAAAAASAAAAAGGEALGATEIAGGRSCISARKSLYFIAPEACPKATPKLCAGPSEEFLSPEIGVAGATRSLFRQLQWQVLHEARTGSPPRIIHISTDYMRSNKGVRNVHM